VVGELFAVLSNGKTWRMTNDARVQLVSTPKYLIDVQPGAGAAVFLEKWKQFGEASKALGINEKKNTFEAVFEVMYVQSLVARMANGASRNLMKMMGVEDKPPALSDARFVLEEKIRAQFRSESKLSDAQWEKAEGSMLIINEQMTADQAMAEISVLDPHDAGQRVASSPDPLIAFSVENAKLKPEEQFRKLGSVSSPVRADLYVIPQEVDVSIVGESQVS
jgi:hypothetical protein